ncbi:MAG: glycosyltransferase family 2 protein [Oscillospiraceae bacterium]|nr:glycosyltransferase family 2 protein [Oscillospiraceae bacterium]
MEALKIFNFILGAVFFICYAYQFFYIPVVFAKKEPVHKKEKRHRFAVLICARNEEKVIAQLIESIHAQSYGREKIRVFVMADNCTDSTARTARNAGARVYTRFDSVHTGKGYALESLLEHIGSDYPKEYFDGYFVFDADNLLDKNYIEEMNRTFCDGYDIITGYRNSKNYGDNWISAGYSLWFLRESRFLNHARFLVGNSCAVSGTGFFFSRRILEKHGGWPFHLLTEDIEFTVKNVLEGEKTGFCKNAVLYDEQPTSFVQSWHQRMRWAKGYLQVFGKYGNKLIKGIFKGDFSCFDMAMAIMPAVAVSVIGAAVNAACAVFAAVAGKSIAAVLFSAAEGLLGMYFTMFFIGVITTASEWKQIRCSVLKKIFYCFTFPLFMFTYIPISFAAIFAKAEWKPIKHSVAVGIGDLCKKEGA